MLVACRSASLACRTGPLRLRVIWVLYNIHARHDFADMGDRGRGRGWYYKEKYGGRGGGGGGGRGGGRGQRGSYMDVDEDAFAAAAPQRGTAGGGQAQGSHAELERNLQRINGKQYPAYRDVEGQWQFPSFSFFLDKAQSDPFAAPSKCRVTVPAQIAAIPADLTRSKIRLIALSDYFTRRFGEVVSAAGADIRTQSGGWSGEKGGEMGVDTPGQHVLERSSVIIDANGNLEARFTVALPARGRTVLGDWASAILVQNLPQYVQKGLYYGQQNDTAVRRHVECVEDTEALRSALPGLGLVAFIGNGAILPRRSGASDLPMSSNEAVPFESPPSLSVDIALPNRGTVSGMGIRKGVTLVVGGGFHGKTTLLKAVEAGVYNKVLGDGRELVATDPSAVKVRAEDGRRVEGVDITPFINNLPFGRDTSNFRSSDASGSTSQAANIQEALEVGAQTLLVDEDTCATNFMIRDARMQALVAKDKEPITPFISKISALSSMGVSCILVIGGSGDYFDVADVVVCMDCFRPKDVTAEAHSIAKSFGGAAALNGATADFGNVTARVPTSIYPAARQGERDIKVSTRTIHTVSFGDEELDLSAVEQLAEKSQTRAIACALQLLRSWLLRSGGNRTLSALLDQLEQEMNAKGLDALDVGYKNGSLARPRRFEIAAAVNRIRSLQVANRT